MDTRSYRSLTLPQITLYLFRNFRSNFAALGRQGCVLWVRKSKNRRRNNARRWKRWQVSARRVHVGMFFKIALVFMNWFSPFRTHNKRKLGCRYAHNGKAYKKYFLFLYYNFLPKHLVCVDEIDRTPNCFKLRWDREDDINNELYASRSYDLLLENTIRGYIHVLWNDSVVAFMDENLLRKLKLENLFEGNSTLKMKTIYGNLFYRFKNEAFNI